MGIFLLNILLAVAWASLEGEFSGVNLLAGFVLGYFALWLTQFVMGTSNYFVKLRQVVELLALFTWELIRANLRVAYSVLAPFSSMRPGIVAVPLDLKSDLGITTLANMITLTPGTLSIDVSDDRKVVYVHGMHVDHLEDFKHEIKDGFERKVMEVFE
ncbi:MAG: Na+/H+ antiporter subunit E [Anaerolineae bacterium]|nr:Na+/H+ antiporter subunit E [Anaerolineae bacterium]